MQDLPAFLAHRAERRADQARVLCLAELVMLALIVLALAAPFAACLLEAAPT